MLDEILHRSFQDTLYKICFYRMYEGQHAIVIMTKYNQLRDCLILVAEYSTVPEAILMNFFKGLLFRVTLSLQMPQKKLCVCKDIINLVKNVKLLFFFLKNIVIYYLTLRILTITKNGSFVYLCSTFIFLEVYFSFLLKK